MRNPSSGSRVVACEQKADRRQTDRQTEIERERERDRQRVVTNLVISFHNRANAPRSHEDLHQIHIVDICNSLHTCHMHVPSRLLQLLTKVTQSDKRISSLWSFLQLVVLHLHLDSHYRQTSPFQHNPPSILGTFSELRHI